MKGERAAFKVGVKNALRNRRRTLFLLLLVAVPVALGVVVAGIVRATNLTPDQRVQVELGNAAARVWVGADRGDVLTWVRTAVEGLDPSVETVEFRETGLRSRQLGFARVSDVDITNPITKGMLLVLDGEPPTHDGEVALSPAVAERLDVGIGDEIDLSDLELGALRVVGLVSEPLASSDARLLLSPGALERADIDSGVSVLIGGDGADQIAQGLQDLWYGEGQQLFWPTPAVDPKPEALDEIPDDLYVFLTADQVAELVELAANTDSGETFGLLNERAWEMVYVYGRAPADSVDIYVESRSDLLRQSSFESNVPLLSTGAAAVLLIEVAFVAGAAFAAGTRRRLREIGLLGVNGASEGQVRVTVLGEGLAIAVAGSLVGALVGVVLFAVGRPLIQPRVSLTITGVGIELTDVLGPIVVALLSVAFAVWLPARTAGRVPVTAALQGRMPAAAPRRWTVPAGVAAAGLGAALMTVALGSVAADLANAFVALGCVLTVGGVALLASPILAGLTRLADRVPATGRLVVRDSGRHRTRASVAAAAIMVTLLGPVIGITLAAMAANQSLVNGLPEPTDQILLMNAEGPTFSDVRPITVEDVDAVTAILPTKSAAVFETIEMSVRTQEEADRDTAPQRVATVGLGSLPDRVAIATDDLLATIGDDRVSAAVRAGNIVVLGVEDDPTVIYFVGSERPAVEYAVPVLTREMPRVLVPPAAAAQYADQERRMMALIRLQRAPTSQELERLGSLRLSISRSFGSITGGSAYLILAGVTLGVVLIVIALVTAVSAAEVDEELRTIVAVGAPGSFRRRFLGLLTSYQTFIAALLALPLGLGLIKVFTAAHRAYYEGPFGEVDGSDMVFSWPQLAGIVIGIPVLVGVLTAVSVRSAPVIPPRRVT
jgi:hypothetical protein